MRDISIEAISALEADAIAIIILVRLDYESGVVAINSTDYHITYNGETYYGLGSIASIGTVKETVDQQANTINLQLTGIDRTLIAQSLNESYQGRDAKIMILILDPETNEAVAEPVVLFRGKMDNQSIDFGDTATITLSCVGRLADLMVARTRRYNNIDQQSVYPNDKGLEFVAAAVNADVSWGK